MKPAGWIALSLAAVAGVFVLGWRQSREPEGKPSAPAAASSPDLRRELEALRTENAALRRRLESPAPSPSVPSIAAAPSVSVPDLLAQARASLRSRDGSAFEAAFLALLDAGERGFPAVLALVEEKGLVSLFEDLDPRIAQRIHRGMILRSPALGGLLDLALGRADASPHALDLAATLYETGVEGGMPREAQVALLLGLLRKEGENGDSGRVHRLADLLLGTLKAAEALPDVEKLFGSLPDDRRSSLAYALGAMNRPESLALLKRLAESTPDGRARLQILYGLNQARGPEANAVLWEMEAKERDADCRRQILQALAARPENLDRMLARMKDPQGEAEDRQAALWGILQASQGNEEVRAALWRLYDAEPAQQELILTSALQYRDPRAKALLFDRLRTGQVSEALSQHLQALDPREIRSNQDPIRALAGSAPSFQTRGQAFMALSRVDPGGAVRAFLMGYDRLDDEGKVHATNYLAWSRTPEGAEALKGIAANDPSEAVRQAAAMALQQWK